MPRYEFYESSFEPKLKVGSRWRKSGRSSHHLATITGVSGAWIYYSLRGVPKQTAAFNFLRSYKPASYRPTPQK